MTGPGLREEIGKDRPAGEVFIEFVKKITNITLTEEDWQNLHYNEQKTGILCNFGSSGPKSYAQKLPSPKNKAKSLEFKCWIYPYHPSKQRALKKVALKGMAAGIFTKVTSSTTTHEVIDKIYVTPLV